MRSLNLIDKRNIIEKKYNMDGILHKNKKVDFGGIHTSVEQSKKDIINFIKIIYENNATHLEAGNS